MRNLFWILLLGNVAFFAVMQRGGFGWNEPEFKAQPYLHGEMIRLMPASIPVTSLEPVSAPVPVAASSAPALASSPLPSNPPLSPNVAAATAAKPGAPVCLEWGDFSGLDLARATAALSTLQLADKLSQRQIERDIGYWVYIPPLENKTTVNRKVAELKKLGVKEYFVVQTPGHWLNAISLGVFKTQDAAQNFLNLLQTMGVRTAQVGERVSKLKFTLFTLNNVDAKTAAKLTSMQKDFAGSELNNIPCTH